MDAAAVKTLLENHLENCTFHVEGEGANYNIEAGANLLVKVPK